MKLDNLILVNAILFIALGIAFALYGPLIIDAFGVLGIADADGAAFWFSASFARLAGAILFGYGFLIWSIHSIVSGGFLPAENIRRITLALLLGNIVGLFVATTQQWQVWVNLAGWISIGIFAILTLGYAYFLVRKKSFPDA